MELANRVGVCLELRKRGRKECGCHPNAGVEYCAFLKGRMCHVSEHNKAIHRAFEAGANRESIPQELLPENYRLPKEKQKGVTQ